MLYEVWYLRVMNNNNKYHLSLLVTTTTNIKLQSLFRLNIIKFVRCLAPCTYSSRLEVRSYSLLIKDIKWKTCIRKKKIHDWTYVDSNKPTAIWFMLWHLQECARQSECFSLLISCTCIHRNPGEWLILSIRIYTVMWWSLQNMIYQASATCKLYIVNTQYIITIGTIAYGTKTTWWETQLTCIINHLVCL